MSTEETKNTQGRSAGPSFQQKVHGKVEEIEGKAQLAHAKRTGDLGEGLEGAAKQLHGKIEHTLGVVVEEAIGQSEREGAAGVLEGHRHQVHGAMEEAAGKAQADLGRRLQKPEQEQEGIARQVAGQIEKGIGKIQQEAAKEEFHDALRDDAEYMKPKH